MTDPAPGAVILGALLYVVVATIAVLYVAIPGVLILAPVVAAGGVLATFGAVMATFLGSPASVDTASLPADRGTPPDMRPPRSPGAEPAWSHYLRAQLADDVWTAASRLANLATRPWAWTTSAAQRLSEPWLWGPVLVLPYALCAVATVAVLVTGVAAGVVVAAAAGLLWMVRHGCVWAARLTDRIRRRRLGSAATCPRPGCHEVTDLPVVQCGCGRRHYQLRPGRFGVFRRRCGCGRMFPTTVTRAAAAEASEVLLRCPLCDSALPPDAMLGTDVRIAVIGADEAGQTWFTAAVAELENAVRSAGGAFHVLPQPHSGTAELLPTCTSMNVSWRHKRGTAHVFNAPEELFENRGSSPVLHYLQHVHGLVLVIDPAALPWLAGDTRNDAGPTEPVEIDPELAYRAVTQRLRDGGAELSAKSLAVVLAKSDVLPAPGAGHRARAESARVRRWLVDHGVDNLVLAAERDFATVRYFVSAATTEHSASAARPLAWLAGRAGLPLPRNPLPRNPLPRNPLAPTTPPPNDTAPNDTAPT